jgi:hypothetical protein
MGYFREYANAPNMSAAHSALWSQIDLFNDITRLIANNKAGKTRIK